MFKAAYFIWFEYIRTDSNWSDGISRDGLIDDIVVALNSDCKR